MFSLVTLGLAGLATVQHTTASAAGHLHAQEANQHAHQQQQHVFDTSPAQQSQPDSLRVAVIGAGSAGSSSVYFLRFLSDHGLLPPVELDLYEKEDYVGGRSTTVQLPYGPADEETPIAEVGASIFVEKNWHLAHATKVFNLTTQSGHGGGRIEDALMAVWDGEQYVYQDTNGWGWWNTGKILWKYGMSPIKVRSLMKAMLSKFISIYSPDFQAQGPYRSIADLAKQVGFGNLYEIAGSSYLQEHGVSADFTSDLIAAGTTVNYAQTPQEMHALETLVSVAAEGASSVRGGNRRIFEQFASRSGAALHLEHQVTSLKKLESAASTPQWQVTSHSLNSGKSMAKVYDAVIVAAPWHQMGLKVSEREVEQRVGPSVDYVDLHVTIVVTNATAPQACFFNPQWACKDAAPKTVLATLAPWQSGKVSSAPRVNSLNYLRELEKGKYAVKIFSRHALSQDELNEAFGVGNVLWSHHQPWLSYPFVRPLKATDFGPLHLDQGLYYTSPMEQLISTMETSSISAWNAVSMIVADFTPNRVNSSWPEW